MVRLERTRLLRHLFPRLVLGTLAAAYLGCDEGDPVSLGDLAGPRPMGATDAGAPRADAGPADTGPSDDAGDAGDGGELDLTGPIITFIDPTPARLVGGKMIIAVEVVDEPSGVDRASVRAVLGLGLLEIAEVPLSSVGTSSAGSSVFSAEYDTALLRAEVEARFGDSIQLVLPTLTIRAKDQMENETVVGIEIAMDYTPPVLSLDPPPLREGRFEDGLLVCSLEFDPLGEDATDPDQTVWQLSEFRARIQDRGNSGLTMSEVRVPFANLDLRTPQLFVLDDLANAVARDALVVDTDGDGRADDINPVLVPSTDPTRPDQVLVVDLEGILPDGESEFIPDEANPMYPGYPSCNPPMPDDPDAGTAEEVPGPVCVGHSRLTRVIEPVFGGFPAIFAPGPVSELFCLGLPFDSVASNIQDGWACVAVRAADNLGNVGVSPPMRVCFDYDDSEVECEGPPPADVDCYGSYDRATGTSNANAVVAPPPDFSPFELQILFE